MSWFKKKKKHSCPKNGHIPGDIKKVKVKENASMFSFIFCEGSLGADVELEADAKCKHCGVYYQAKERLSRTSSPLALAHFFQREAVPLTVEYPKKAKK